MASSVSTSFNHLLHKKWALSSRRKYRDAGVDANSGLFLNPTHAGLFFLSNRPLSKIMDMVVVVSCVCKLATCL